MTPKLNNIASLIVILCSCNYPLLVTAQICQPESIAQTSSPSNFTRIDIAIIEDTVTGLLWQRCALGQQATETACTGIATKMTWQEAIQASFALNDGWRLPNIKELASIINYQCFTPPYNLTTFPNTPTSRERGFWTSTPGQKNISGEEEETTAWISDLWHGQLKRSSVMEKHYVRLVKSAQ